jgi:Tol biopolymer transport system component
VSLTGPAGFAGLSASNTGSVAYRTGSAGSRQLVWFDRSGKELRKVDVPQNSPAYMSVSPDQHRVAIQRSTDGNVDIWLLELDRSGAERFTTQPGPDIVPIWSPDGDSLVFSAPGKTTLDLFQKGLAGGPPQLLLSTADAKQATDWSRDGRYLLYRAVNPSGDMDVWALPMFGDKKPFPVVQTNFMDRDAQFSPDGKWIAYQANDSGRYEIYVQPFPGPGKRTLVSANGGAQARWRRDGKELFYVALDGKLMAVPFEFASGGQVAKPGMPIPLFFAQVGSVQDVSLAHYSVSNDGQRFLIDTRVEEAVPPINILLNWKPR